MSTKSKTGVQKSSQGDKGEATPHQHRRYLNELLTSLHSPSEEREARWRREQCEREMQLKLEAEERERTRQN
jgi:hypothetical protein